MYITLCAVGEVHAVARPGRVLQLLRHWPDININISLLSGPSSLVSQSVGMR